jgi:hypothetical protein
LLRRWRIDDRVGRGRAGIGGRDLRSTEWRAEYSSGTAEPAAGGDAGRAL